MNHGRIPSKRSLPQITHSAGLCENPDVVMIHRCTLMVWMLHNPIHVSFHPQLHACPSQARHRSIRVSQSYPSNHRSFFCEVDLIYSGGEGEKNLAVFFSCEIYQCTYLYNLLRLFIQITFLLQKSLPFIQGHVKGQHIYGEGSGT